MTTVLGILATILVLIVGAWLAVFGGIGAILARKRGGSAWSGLAWGSFLGPVGWAIVMWKTARATRQEPITLAEWAGEFDLRGSEGDAQSGDLGHRI